MFQWPHGSFNSFPGTWPLPSYGNPADTWNTLSLSSDRRDVQSFPLDERVERREEAHSDRLVGFKRWYAAMLVVVDRMWWQQRLAGLRLILGFRELYNTHNTSGKQHLHLLGSTFHTWGCVLGHAFFIYFLILFM